MEVITTINDKIYQDKLKPDGWQILHIGPTTSWRTEWGEWESIRDIVQNALDETESFSIEHIDNDLIIKDTGTGLAIRDLLLGAQKPKESYMRGKFGEGLKVAALSLLRAGYGLRVETVGKSVVFCMYTQEVDSVNISTLAALWKENLVNEYIGGTSIIIQGYSEDQPIYEDRFIHTANLVMLHKEKSKIKTPRQRYSMIYRANKGQAAIFCRDIYLRDIEGAYSYNLWDFELSPDRHAPKYEFEVWQNISHLWQTISDEHLMIEFLKAIRDKSTKYLNSDIDMDIAFFCINSDHVSYKSIMEANADKWQRAFQKVYGNKSVVRTNGSFELSVNNLGYTAVELPSGLQKALCEIIETDEKAVKDVVENLEDVDVIPDITLDPRHLMILNAMRDIVVGIAFHVKVVDVAHLPMMGDTIPIGLWHEQSSSIFLSPTIITNFNAALKITLHELAHSLSGAKDNTDLFLLDMQVIAQKAFVYAMNHPDFAKKYSSIIG